MEDKSTSVAVGKGGVYVDAGKGKPGGTSVDIGEGGVDVDTGKGKAEGGTNVIVGGKGGGVSVSRGRKGKPVDVEVFPFIYKYAATQTQLHAASRQSLFFLEKDLRPGTELHLRFTKSSNAATFLPRQVVKSIPFSSNKVQDILNRLSVKRGSEEAELMKNTIKECEETSIGGEEKYCATSLESMVDFSISKLGKNVEAMSTEVEKKTQLQKYTVNPGGKKVGGNKGIVCHKQNYPYAVFYCHYTESTRVYSVALNGDDGARVKAIAICHTDTSEWYPKHLAFQVLKVKPGTVPVCHFLPNDHVVWVPR
nr:BURP domain protein RD22-2 [Gleditsia microphylla]